MDVYGTAIVSHAMSRGVGDVSQGDQATFRLHAIRPSSFPAEKKEMPESQKGKRLTTQPFIATAPQSPFNV